MLFNARSVVDMTPRKSMRIIGDVDCVDAYGIEFTSNLS